MTVFQEHSGLLKRFRDGCREALEVVYRHYFSDVFRLFRRGFVTGTPPTSVPALDDDRSGELVQEVFLKAFDERGRLAYDGLRPYRPYLLRIAKNLRIDVARRERHRVAEGDGNAAGPGIDIDQVADEGSAILPGGYEETLDWQAKLQATQEFVAGLPDIERRFVTLRFVDEQPQADVAAALKVTRRRVRTLEKRIQDRLQQHLHARGLA
jgi:RNA polymerase sigma-70 factor (ECF subfamily)